MTAAGAIGRAVRRITMSMAVAVLVVGCQTGPPATTAQPSIAATAAVPSATPAASPTSMPSLAPSVPAASRGAFTGILETRPEGWFFQVVGFEVAGFPATHGHVYGPEGLEVPPEEGPGRIVLYETIPASRAYLDYRIDLSRDRGGSARSVTVNGQPAEVWVDDGTGELLLGWELSGKSEVLVANDADYTVEQLVESAESVADCCG